MFSEAVNFCENVRNSTYTVSHMQRSSWISYRPYSTVQYSTVQYSAYRTCVLLLFVLDEWVVVCCFLVKYPKLFWKRGTIHVQISKKTREQVFLLYWSFYSYYNVKMCISLHHHSIVIIGIWRLKKSLWEFLHLAIVVGRLASWKMRFAIERNVFQSLATNVDIIVPKAR
jgi:hypothetical protein